MNSGSRDSEKTGQMNSNFSQHKGGKKTQQGINAKCKM